jgi:carbonic anhydrase
MNSTSPQTPTSKTSHTRDYVAGLVVFLVALPLCLGIALASNAPLLSGLISGIIGGIVVGFLSGSHTSVSGPAAGLAAVVTSQLVLLGSFENFLVAVMFAGVLQIGLGSIRAGLIALFFPSSVIKGLLAAIGVLLIIKQIPHVIGAAPKAVGGFYFGATAIGAISVALLLIWDRIGFLKKLPTPSALVVVAVGIGLNTAFASTGSSWSIPHTHLVQIPAANSLSDLYGFMPSPTFTAFLNPTVYISGVTIAIIASLETLLNLSAVDKIDPLRRVSPPNRELLAQGVGNLLAGFLGGLPITSVIVRSSVNVSTGAKSRRSVITHGFLLLAAVALFPKFLNQIPLASLAAILLLTGFKLASPKVVKAMWKEGWRPFLAFGATVVAIVTTDLLVGILIGLAISVGYILHNTFRAPLRMFLEKHAAQHVVRIELSSQVGFFSRARLENELNAIPSGSHVLIDARRTDFVDPDVLDMLNDFRFNAAPARGVSASFLGFKSHYDKLGDQIEFVDFTTRDVREQMIPTGALDLLSEGNRRFRSGNRLTRDLVRQSSPTDRDRVPFATIISCVDSGLPVENLFDLGAGDVFSVRVAGNVPISGTLGTIEYGCRVVGTRFLLVLGHTHCSTIETAIEAQAKGQSTVTPIDCEHFAPITAEIQKSIEPGEALPEAGNPERAIYIDDLARRNVVRIMGELAERSKAIAALISEGKLGLAGGIYHHASGLVEFFDATGTPIGNSGHPDAHHD